MLASGREEGGRNSNCERRGGRGKVCSVSKMGWGSIPGYQRRRKWVGVAYLSTRGVERERAIIATFLGPYFVPDGEA